MAHLRPGQDTCPRRRWAQVPDHRYPLMINGVPVVEAPEEIDICNAEQLRIVLLEAASRGHATIVVDMTRTRFCDSSGFSVLVAAHQRALAEGGGLRLVIPDGCRVLRIFTVIGLVLQPDFVTWRHSGV